MRDKLNFQVVQECGCLLADWYHTTDMSEDFQYCGAMSRYKDVEELLDGLSCAHRFLFNQRHNYEICHCHKQCQEIGICSFSYDFLLSYGLP